MTPSNIVNSPWQNSENCDKIERENIRKSSIHFLKNHSKYREKFDLLTKNQRDWIVDYPCSGKGVIPYESIKSWSDLDYVPKNEFFRKTEFFSSLKNSTISDVEYENVKKFWNILGLSDLNDIYSFQDTIILCEIFENRANQMSKKFPFNPRKCSSASSLSRCIHRHLFKVIISFPIKRWNYLKKFL